MMWWYGDGMTGWGYVLLTASMVLFWGVVLFGVIAVVRYAGRSDRSTTADGPNPEQLLAERFARGEIDEQVFRQRLDVLRSPSRPLTKT
jgi:putative membrane protein